MICGSRCLPHVPPRVLPKFVDPAATFNAPAERVAEYPFFRDAFRSKKRPTQVVAQPRHCAAAARTGPTAGRGPAGRRVQYPAVAWQAQQSALSS
jgi:hypothetical protein